VRWHKATALEEDERMQDKREQSRAEVDVEVQYRTVQEFLGAYARNISGGGVFIHSQRVLPLNQPVRLRFTLPGVSHRFETGGIVVWSNPSPSRGSLPSGMGIKFLDLDSKDRGLIEEFVKSKIPPPRP
jgi:type IV pilus assembly protein PilZ